jgi:tetratricopeptide (TPR) repeat protein
MATETARVCEQCGQVIPPGQDQCPHCGRGKNHGPLSRETILLLSLLGLVLLFVVTGFTAKLYHSKERLLAQEWYSRGEAELRAGKAQASIKDFRSALLYSPDNALYRLRLAQGLIAANRLDEARAHLLNLWEREPGDGTVNLELARLAVLQKNTAEATRYFHNAIFGVWERNPEERRRQVRLELCEFLLSRGMRAEAQAALIELATDLPREAAIHARVGSLFMRAGDHQRALQEFQQAVGLNPRMESAQAGAGEAAYQMGNYRDARRYLARAVRLDSKDSNSAHLLETTDLVLSIDPLERGLSAGERARRVVRAFQQGVKRLEQCAQARGESLEGKAPLTELQAIYARAQKIRPQVREWRLERNSDLLMNTMDLVFEIEEFGARHCGAPTGLDLALLLVARKHGGAES